MTVPVIRLTGIEKTYPGVKSLDRVDFTVMSSEIHALLGENGAGKSTLTSVIGGAVRPDAGTIEYLGRPVAWRSPKEAQAAGIHVIHQELALFPELTVAENILLTKQPLSSLGFISPRARLQRAEEALQRLGVSISASARVGDLTLADQQMVEIAKALVGKPRLLVFDEPTAVIAGREVDLLFDNMRRMRSQGIGIVYISHRLDEIFEPAPEAVLRPARRPQQNDPGCLHEECAQVTVTALGDAPGNGSVSGRHLLRDQADPGRKIPPSRERRATADRGNHRTRDDWADAGHGHDPSATVITFCQRLDLVGYRCNSLIEPPPITGKISDDADDAR
jgi:ABC-type uncharacterized transport system ATPase subunit